MKVGITATRDGLTQHQTMMLIDRLRALYEDSAELHHGCCVGGDAAAAKLAKGLGYRVVAHPPIKKALMSQGSLHISDEVREDKDYLDRNRDIVDESDILIALPRDYTENIRHGTWYTYRYAKNTSVPTIVIFPDATTRE
jgi:hypothetical protein